MTVLRPGENTSFIIRSGKVATVVATGNGKIWFTKPGQQDVLAKSVAAGANIQLGPYVDNAGVRVECATGEITVTTDFDATLIPSELSLKMGALVKAVSGSTYTLSDADHGYMLLFAAACTVTVPTGLRADFSCGWSQESAGAVTFAAGSGATINSVGAVLASSAQYSVGGVAAFAQNTFRLMGV